MARIWQIEEQTFTVPDINYAFQFGSVHTEEVANGNEPPVHDQEIFLCMWDPTRTKCLKLTFDRNGLMVRTELDNGEAPPIGLDPNADSAPARDGYPVNQEAQRTQQEIPF